MKKYSIKYGIHILFPFLIFVFVSRLCSYVLQYRKTFVSADTLEVSILSTLVIVILLSVVYGVLIGRSFGSDSTNITAKPAKVKEIKKQ